MLDRELHIGASLMTQPAGGSVPDTATPWFEWNGTDLTQFDTKVVGADVSSSTISLVSYVGLNWVSISVSTNFANNWTSSICVLPITTVPPSNEYIVEADVVMIQKDSGSAANAFVAARYTSVNSFYGFMAQSYGGCAIFKQRSGGTFELASIDMTTNVLPNVSNSAREGCRLGFRVVSPTDAILSHDFGFRCFQQDPGVAFGGGAIAAYTVVGQAAIGAVADVINGVGAETTINYFRNIRCWQIPSPFYGHL